MCEGSGSLAKKGLVLSNDKNHFTYSKLGLLENIIPPITEIESRGDAIAISRDSLESKQELSLTNLLEMDFFVKK